MLSVANHMFGCSGNSRRSARLICWGLQRSRSLATTNSNNARFSIIFNGRTRRRRAADRPLSTPAEIDPLLPGEFQTTSQHLLLEEGHEDGETRPQAATAMGVEGAALPGGMQVASQFPTNRRRGASQLSPDRGRPQAAAGQVKDPDALVLGQEPGRDLTDSEGLKRWHDENLVAGNHRVASAPFSSVADTADRRRAPRNRWATRESGPLSRRRGQPPWLHSRPGGRAALGLLNHVRAPNCHSSSLDRT